MAGVDVTVLDAMWLPLHVDLTVNCYNTVRRSEVERDVRATLAALFSYDNMDFDERITVGDINAALFGVKGVSFAVVNGIGVSPQTLSQDPLFADQIAVNAVPYWDDNHLTLKMVGGI
jgi:predicted membrane protein